MHSVLGHSFCHIDTGKPNRVGDQCRKYYSLGVHKCPEVDCPFVQAARHPRSKKKLGHPPPPAKCKCPVHDLELQHIPCTGGDPTANPRIKLDKPPCTVVTISNDNSSTVKVLHCGNHNHPRPPNTHPSQEAKRKLREIVESNPGAGPAKLKVGVGNAPPADQIDPAFMNEDRLAYERRKILDANKPKGIKGGIGAFHALA